MKYLFVFLLLGLISCGDATENASVDPKESSSFQVVGCDDLDFKEGISLDDLGKYNLGQWDWDTAVIHILKSNGKPFTGIHKCEMDQDLGYTQFDSTGRRIDWGGADRVILGYSIGEYKNGKLIHSKWYDKKDGLLIQDAERYNSAPRGTTKTWWANGKIRSESKYEDPRSDISIKLDARQTLYEAKSWYPNGQLESEERHERMNLAQKPHLNRLIFFKEYDKYGNRMGKIPLSKYEGYGLKDTSRSFFSKKNKFGTSRVYDIDGRPVEIE